MDACGSPLMWADVLKLRWAGRSFHLEPEAGLARSPRLQSKRTASCSPNSGMRNFLERQLVFLLYYLNIYWSNEESVVFPPVNSVWSVGNPGGAQLHGSADSAELQSLRAGMWPLTGALNTVFLHRAAMIQRPVCVCAVLTGFSLTAWERDAVASLLRLTPTRGGSRKWSGAHSAGFVCVRACVRLVVVGEQFVQVGHPLLRVLSFQQRVHQVALRGETPRRHVVSEWHLMLLLTHCLAHLVSLVTL